MPEPERGDVADVENLVTTYALASQAADADRLRAIFHPTAHMYGTIGDRQIATPLATFFDHVARSAPCEVGYAFQIESVRVDGPTAVAVLLEKNYQGRDYRDVFTCAKFDGRWTIVSKLFAVQPAGAQ